ncbi:ATP-binding protein [Spirosoma montaniterrae]|uniref:histidine kinase n=1 Tax=Spirosoma montaniterrae TaxID=1178516 RepID=A0A1P9X2A7_9BACT|nr:ATP-binding protein [Spirosoma montaniterrae]AQG81767.1 hypothetical protein AWR27_22150 [Spirosoma montaniterrae]
MLTRRYTQRYILALSLVAGLTIFGQVLVQRQLRDQTSDSYLVNYAGRQRFQSQQIVKTVLLLTDGSGLRPASAVRAELTPVLARWERYHRELKSGNLTDLGLRRTNSDSIRAMFARLDPHFRLIQQHTHRLLHLTDQPAGAADAVRASVRVILANEQPFLLKMDAIVRQYAHEAETKVERLRGIELVLMIVTLFVLLLEALLIFLPGVRILRSTIGQLTDSERETRRVNDELRYANEYLQVTQKQLLQETDLRHQQRLNEQRIRLASVVQGQENERKRLSRELHDGIGQMLTGLKLLVENIRSIDQLTDKDQSTFANLKTLLVRTIQETRTVSNNLMPPVLSDFGLVSALRLLIDQQCEQTPATVQLDTTLTTERYGPAVEIGLYRIVQEAVNNAVKHANASYISVRLDQRNGRLSLRITDDGCGLGKHTSTDATQGMHNMRERARLLDGTFRITSQAGTRIVVSVPIRSLSTSNVATQVMM